MTDKIVERLDQLESRLDSLSTIAVDNDGNIEEIQREVGGLRQDYDDRLTEIEKRLEGLTQSLGFIEQAIAAEASSVEARAALCLETLVNEAEKNDGKARMDHDGVQKALNHEIHRTTSYDVMEKMDAVCEAVDHYSEDRNADKNTRVELRLDPGENLVSTVAGRRIEISRTGGVADE